MEYDMKKYFEYLEALRASGAVNMFGATAYLQRDFGLKYKEASLILLRWIESKK